MIWSSYHPFSTAEDQFLLSLLNWKHSSTAHQDIERRASDGLNWARIKAAEFALPDLHTYLRKSQRGSSIPKEIRDWAESLWRRNLLVNEFRVELARKVAQSFQSSEIKVIFLKGAAEIVQFYRDNDYLAGRMMDDIDFICPVEDVDRADDVLRGSGHVRNLRGRAPLGRVAQWEKGQFEYNHWLELMELHWKVSSEPRSLACYPEDFAKELISSSRTVSVKGTRVLLPRLEHMFIYLICAASHWRDNALAVSSNRGQGFLFPWDTYCEDRVKERFADIGSIRFDAQQLFFLFRLRRFLDSCGKDLDYREVERMLARVADRSLLEIYLGVAMNLLKGLPSFFASGLPLSRVLALRERFIRRTKFEILKSRIVQGIPRRWRAMQERVRELLHLLFLKS